MWCVTVLRKEPGYALAVDTVYGPFHSERAAVNFVDHKWPKVPFMLRIHIQKMTEHTTS